MAPLNTNSWYNYDELIQVRQKCRCRLEKYGVLIRESPFDVKPNDSNSSNTILTICITSLTNWFFYISFNLTQELSVDRRPGAVNYSVSILSRSKVINNLLKTLVSAKSPIFFEYLLFLFFSGHHCGTVIFWKRIAVYKNLRRRYGDCIAGVFYIGRNLETTPVKKIWTGPWI